jgi:hypothetical protein
VTANLPRDIAHEKLEIKSFKVASVYTHNAALGVLELNPRENYQMCLFCVLVSSLLFGCH